MQIQKDEVRKRILNVAKEEFVSKGVRRTSMRTIAERTGIAVGNIYHYFHSKDELFVAVCKPALNELEAYAEQENGPYFQTLDVFTEDSYLDQFAERFISIVSRYKTELRLILFEATGTMLENYFERFSDGRIVDGNNYIAAMKEKYPQINADISPYFMQLMCIIWFDVLRIIVQNDNMTKDDIKLLIENYFNYGMGGWKMIFKV